MGIRRDFSWGGKFLGFFQKGGKGHWKFSKQPNWHLKLWKRSPNFAIQREAGAPLATPWGHPWGYCYLVRFTTLGLIVEQFGSYFVHFVLSLPYLHAIVFLAPQTIQLIICTRHKNIALCIFIQVRTLRHTFHSPKMFCYIAQFQCFIVVQNEPAFWDFTRRGRSWKWNAPTCCRRLTKLQHSMNRHFDLKKDESK